MFGWGGGGGGSHNWGLLSNYSQPQKWCQVLPPLPQLSKYGRFSPTVFIGMRINYGVVGSDAYQEGVYEMINHFGRHVVYVIW